MSVAQLVRALLRSLQHAKIATIHLRGVLLTAPLWRSLEEEILLGVVRVLCVHFRLLYGLLELGTLRGSLELLVFFVSAVELRWTLVEFYVVFIPGESFILEIFVALSLTVPFIDFCGYFRQQVLVLLEASVFKVVL